MMKAFTHSCSIFATVGALIAYGMPVPATAVGHTLLCVSGALSIGALIAWTNDSF